MSEVTAVPLRPIARGSIPRLWLGLGVLVVVAAIGAWYGTGAQVAMATPPDKLLAANARRSGIRTLPSGLQYQILREGAGARATAQDVALVNYEGKLADGEVFDSSARNGGPVPLPVAQMIPGFSQGLELMNRGAKYRFWIPPELGYGPEEKRDPQTGKVAIPANSVLVFDVEIVELAPAAALGGMGGIGGR